MTLDAGGERDRRCASAMPPGHKIALRAIHAGEAVIKYGSPIGLRHGRDCGRRARAHAQRREHAAAAATSTRRSARPREPRLAEPPDERTRRERQNGTETR